MHVDINFVSPNLFEPRFLTKHNGVLYESSTIQIGVKSEFKQSTGMKSSIIFLIVFLFFLYILLSIFSLLGTLNIFFGNKTNFQLAGFTSVVERSADLQNHILSFFNLIV